VVIGPAGFESRQGERFLWKHYNAVVLYRVARWHILNPKIPIWVNFGGYWVLQWKMLLHIFYGHFVYFMVIWYIFPVLVFCTKKNLSTLVV
jgi:hypothetical protein